MSRIVERFRSVGGEKLRVVAKIENVNFNIIYVRDDLEGRYTESDLDDAYKNIVANKLSAEDFGKVGEFGEHDCQVFLFEKIAVFLFPSSRYEGVFVSFDREDSFPFFETVEAADEIPELSNSDETQ